MITTPNIIHIDRPAPTNDCEQACNDYVAHVIRRFECELRCAFYAGVQYGLDRAQDIYNPKP